MLVEFLEDLWLQFAYFFLVLFETFITTITLCLPDFVIQWFTRQAKSLLNHTELSSDKEYNARVKSLIDAESFAEICDIFGYKGQEHVVQTSDGYILGLHRITGRRSPQSPRNSNKPVVYLHHGLLMDSEVWVSCTDPSNSVAFALSDLGYDVWLGNNRGNKYSKKHCRLSPSDPEFWNFSIDEFALYDIPDSIRYVLSVTRKESLTYIGFSQGTAQAFASLSIHPLLNPHVNAFIALAPAMAPPGIQPRRIQAIMNSSPSLLFKMFGRREILKSTAFWQAIMEPNLFVRVIDMSLIYLFNWRGKNITYPQKLVAYNHLYSFTSVKSVVHWFQVIRAGHLQMYDDALTRHPWETKFYQPHHYPTQNITTPVHVIYGNSDSLVDIKALVSSLPDSTQTYEVDGYEHLDILWGKAVPTDIIPRIQSILASATKQALLGNKEQSRRWSMTSQESKKSDRSVIVGALY